jgi:hypothetical protein
MPQSYKILGQSFTNNSANSFQNVYVTGASTSAVINSLYVCNQDPVTANVSIIVRPINEALANKHFVVFEQHIEAGASYILNLGMTVANDTIIAANNFYANSMTTTSSNVSYGAFGLEIT